jgi:hypothetical protein
MYRAAHLRNNPSMNLWRAGADGQAELSQGIAPARQKTNWMGYTIDRNTLNSILEKRTAWVKLMSQQGLILKILNPFVRWQAVVSSQFSVLSFRLRSETNLMGYPQDSKLLSSILGKRTGWPKSMIQHSLILKILKSFISRPINKSNAAGRKNPAALRSGGWFRGKYRGRSWNVI